jgi:hypothetical protein
MLRSFHPIVCYNDCGHAPNFLNVDFYNIRARSVFDVAAMYNNVTYEVLWLSDEWGGEGDSAGEDSDSYCCYCARKLVNACLDYVGVWKLTPASRKGRGQSRIY